MGELFRIDPKLPVHAMKTFAIHSPADTAIPAVCEQVGCLAWRHGWETTVDESTELGTAQALYIRQSSGRTFTEQRTGDGRTVFRFESGQRCFAEHQTRPERYLVLGGDWRGNPRAERRVHARPADWVEDFALHQQKLASRLQEG
jgi:hypothetical protein